MKTSFLCFQVGLFFSGKYVDFVLSTSAQRLTEPELKRTLNLLPLPTGSALAEGYFTNISPHVARAAFSQGDKGLSFNLIFADRFDSQMKQGKGAGSSGTSSLWMDTINYLID